jgi:hypothetical protein
MVDTQTIGETAGDIWKFLEDHGKSTMTVVGKAVKAPAGLVPMAVSWLAREEKLVIAQEKRSVYLWLKEN